MASALDIAREYFPGVPDDRLDDIIWERTGFPGCLGDDPETNIRQQLQEYADTLKLYPGKRLCDFCNTPVGVCQGKEDCMCEKHRESWDKLKTQS